MILVLAYRTDAQARQFVDCFPGRRARLLTSRDLSREGWALRSSAFEQGVLCADGEKLPVRHIRGLVSLLPVIPADELIQIDSADRPYVASEMNAFLAYFLYRLQCPKLNAPGLGSFLGCNWRPERWLAAAAASGFQVYPLRRSTGGGDYYQELPQDNLKTLTLLGDRVVGEAGKTLVCQARDLRRQAGVNYLQIIYRNGSQQPAFVGASVMPNIYESEIRDSIYSYFENFE